MNCPKCGAKCESDQSFCVVCGAPLYSNGDNETVNNIDLNNDDLSATRIVSGISSDLNATKTNIDLHKKDVMETTINRKPIDFEENTFEENEKKKEPQISRFDNQKSRIKNDEPSYQSVNKKPKKKSKKNIIILTILGILFAAVIVVSVVLFTRSKNEEKFNKYYKAGNDYYDAKNYAAAATQYNSASNHAINNSERVSVYEKLWHCYEYMGEYADEEISVLEKLISLNPKEISYYEALIILYQNNDMSDKIDKLIDSVGDYSIKEKLSNFDGTIPNPSVETGTYSKPIEISLHVSNNLDIYYTLDGSEPSEDSTKYSTPIKFEKQGTYTIKAISIDSNGKSSKELTARYRLEFPTVNMPVVSIDSGVYDTQKKITVTADADCKIYYTKDGSIPDSKSTEYTKEIKMPKGNTVFSFIAMNSEGIYSKVVTRVYDYEEVYEYSYDQAVSMLTTILVKNKTMENEYGEYKNGDVAYFTYKSIAKVEKKNYYIVSFSIESDSGSITKEDTYAISCDTGACFRANVSGDSYSLVEIK